MPVSQHGGCWKSFATFFYPSTNICHAFHRFLVICQAHSIAASNARFGLLNLLIHAVAYPPHIGLLHG